MTMFDPTIVIVGQSVSSSSQKWMFSKQKQSLNINIYELRKVKQLRKFSALCKIFEGNHRILNFFSLFFLSLIRVRDFSPPNRRRIFLMVCFYKPLFPKNRMVNLKSFYF
jgi:hypothetical protein